MRPRIEAERLLGTYQAVLAGTGSGKKATMEKWVNEMRAKADGAKRKDGRKPKSVGDWAALGMRVSVEPKGKEE